MVIKKKYWGVQTELSLKNFPIASHKIPLELIYALAMVKKGAAMVNTIGKKKRKVIVKVCEEILRGKLDSHFPLSVWQTGSGTQTNMNVNEVISLRARELYPDLTIHPNDDVNKSQSSNDTVPTAMHIATVLLTKKKLLPHLQTLHHALLQKSKEFRSLIKIGRTHLMDAIPITLGQEFSGYAAQIKQGIEGIEGGLASLGQVALGGTAVGTGLNAPKRFGKKVCALISKWTHHEFVQAENLFAAIGAHDPLVAFSAALRQIAISLLKIGGDVSLMASGPRSGFAEISLPANEPGSSIMPGKVNPTQCEALMMVAVQVMGNDAAVAIAGSRGVLELNTYKPVIIYNILESIHLVSEAAENFAKKCVRGIRPNKKKLQENVRESIMVVTRLNPIIGYEKGRQVVELAIKQGISIKEACLKLKFLTAKRLDAILDVKKMV